VIARNLPGDKPSTEWASPWAGAVIVLGGASSVRDQKMQLRSFSELWKMSAQCFDSGIQRLTIEDIFDDNRTESDIWWQKFMPEVRCPFMFDVQEGFETVLLKSDKLILTIFLISSNSSRLISYPLVRGWECHVTFVLTQEIKALNH